LDIYIKQQKFNLAEFHLLKEVELEGNIKSAYLNLSQVYYETGNKSALEKILNDDALSEYVSDSVRRLHYFQTGQYKEYSKLGFKLGNFTSLGLLGAILILVIWLIFLRKIDVFEPEKIQHLLITLLIACFFSMLATPLYDLFSVNFDFRLTGNYLNDLFFCIFGIGFIEETLKIIPFLIMFRFKNIINESVDYIIYASVCALGFAFMENLIYFNPAGLDNMVSRVLSAGVMHMALTSFIAYGLLYADYKKKASRNMCFLMAFAVSCVVHGVYDFWLLSGGWVGDLKVISTCILVYTALSYSFIITKALNLSEFDTGDIQVVRTFEFLLIAVTLVLIYQYLVIATEYGVANANINLLVEFIVVVMYLFFVIPSLGHFKINRKNMV